MTRPSTIKILIKKKIIIEISAHNSTIGNYTSQNDNITSALPFYDSLQEHLQNSFNSLLNSDNTIINQVECIKKELSNVKEMINMDMEGAYNIIHKIAGWGCLMNSGVRIISEKMGVITQALQKVETYAIHHENI